MVPAGGVVTVRNRWFVAFLLSLVLGAGAPGRAPAQEGSLAPDPRVAAMLAKLSEAPVPPQYSAKILLHVKLKVFPWISLKLNGDSFYKRPGLYRFAFRGVPKAADNFQNIAYDLGNPSVWPAKYDISLLSPAAPGVDAVVRLVPRKHGLVKALDVSVDAVSGHLDKAVWSRYDGGTIVLTQRYAPMGSKEIVAHQEASIAIPHMRADLVADYSNFEMSVVDSPDAL